MGVWAATNVAAQTTSTESSDSETSVSHESARPAFEGFPNALPAQSNITAKQSHQADDVYLRGVRALQRKDFQVAEQEFRRAVALNPLSRDYALALAVTIEHQVTELVEHAARARQFGNLEQANLLLEQARTLDPQSATVRQHFTPDGNIIAPPLPAAQQNDLVRAARTLNAGSLSGPIELMPQPGLHSFHLRASAHDLLDSICNAFGIKASLVTSIGSGPSLRFDLGDADFVTALRVAEAFTHTFAVPLQRDVLLFALDTPENRAQYQPLIEETLYIPGASQDALNEYANLARNVFNLKVVSAVSSSGSLVLRGDEDTLSRVDAILGKLTGSGSDVLLDLTLYEVDKSRVINLGAALPSSVGVFPVAAQAQSLISANQSLISQAIASNLISLTGNAYTDALTELGFLLASGTISSTEFTSLLGVFGHYAGLPLAGVFLGSSTTLNASLSSSDIRVLDTVQLRVGDHQDGSFRAGTRYPIETGLYSSNLSSSVPSAVAGLSINGTSVSSLLSQYLGSSSVAVPQIQFEDLGLTLKATPQILRSKGVTLKLDLKIEALGSGTINGLPILNNRQLTSTVTVPAGGTALLASDVNRTELRSISGLPFLSELPGFQGTEKSTEVDSSEILITLTPHVVRDKGMQVTSRRFLLVNEGKAGQ